MARRKSNAAELKEKRRLKLKEQQRKLDRLAYIIAGVAVAIMITVIIIALV